MSWKSLILAGMLLGAAVAVRADIPPPPKDRPIKGNDKTVQLEVTPTRGNQEPTLELPRNLGGTKKAENEDGPSAFQTAMGGLFLSLGLMCGGFWLVRRRGLSTATAAVVVAGALTLGATGVAWGNMAPIPIRERKLTTNVRVEYTGGSVVRLRLSQEQLSQLVPLVGARPDFRVVSPAQQAPGSAPSK
jgi:hypothetical protein